MRLFGRNLFLGFFVIFLVFCSHKELSHKPDCVSDLDIETRKKSAETLVQRITEDEKAPRWKMLERSCHKVFLTASSANVIIYKSLRTNELYTKLSTGANNEKKSTEECLTKALSVVADLNLPFADAIVEKSKKSFGEQWADKDIGAGSFLSCEDINSANFYTGMDHFLHELNHFASSVGESTKNQMCSLYPWENRLDCVDKNEKLSTMAMISPSRVVFKSNKIKKDALEDLLSTQRVYLGNAKDKGGPMLLIDELRSYAAGTHVLEKIYEKYSKAKIYNSDNKRTTISPHLAVHELMLHLHSLNLKSNNQNNKFNPMICEALKKSDETLKNWFQMLNHAKDQSNATKGEKIIYDHIVKVYGKMSC